ncbi:UNVERIFIED_ORG: hypothetical protein J2X79_002962 [Arthrobacter globiformis]|nr:hypothetical protein [Arthrobacter globiformis]
MNQISAAKRRDFRISVLGRTLEHLGTQMYKRRDVAIAELVANAWDAGATSVRVRVPEESYDPKTSVIRVEDNGAGMTPDGVQSQYLIIGRNRRSDGQEVPSSRKPMGRKGVGKLAGFGLGRKMRVTTSDGSIETTLTLEAENLKTGSGVGAELKIPGAVRVLPDGEVGRPGTVVELSDLKHKTPLDVDKLHQALARRFSPQVLADMKIEVNGTSLKPLEIDFEFMVPKSGVESIKIGDHTITHSAGFSRTVLPTELQGYTILVNGKTAQAPPFFFGVEGSASGQHGTKYLSGVIEADFLDAGTDDDSDVVSTDRQDIDWDDEKLSALHEWGSGKVRELLRQRVSVREKAAVSTVSSNPDFEKRIQMLDPQSKKQAESFIGKLANAATDDQRLMDLADTIIRAFEYQQFHDYVQELEAISGDEEQFAEAISYLQTWRVLESRAVLEVVKGRLEIIDKFFSMLVTDSPETASAKNPDNIHDLLARYPWLIDPEWQVFSEEMTITRRLIEWGHADLGETDRTRYDFMALTGDGLTKVIEIKRAGHEVTLKDVHQLESYVEKLSDARPNISGVFITSEKYALREEKLKEYRERGTVRLFTWAEIHQRTQNHYKQYKAVLQSDIESDLFSRSAKEVAVTRHVILNGAKRTKQERIETFSGMEPSVAPAGDAAES